MLIKLTDATAETCGNKAATLAVLRRNGFAVPDGFVVPAPGQTSAAARESAFQRAVTSELERLGNPTVAVRSSATNEDTAGASAAGQYESFLGVQGAQNVRKAIAACRDSAKTARVRHYWQHSDTSAADAGGMAVLVQSLIAADVSGVMFTPAQASETTRIEATWGLGLGVVSGTVTPDAYEISPHDRAICTTGSKQTRTDLNDEHCGGIVETAVAAPMQAARALNDNEVAALTQLGMQISQLLGGPQDIEFALKNGDFWVLQSRPVTASLPPHREGSPTSPPFALHGRPGAHGVVTAAARLVHGPADFSKVRTGEVLVCTYTDPAWTPLFSIASGVITETGGALSHAAIVARERAIPAVLGVADAMTRLRTGDRITLDGTAGAITVH